MTTSQLLFTTWDFHLPVILGCLVLIGAYLYFVHFKFNLKSVNFVLGVLTIFLALCSPLDTLSDNYLFSAHMTQHMLLHLVAPPLLISGIPAEWVIKLLQKPGFASTEKFLSLPPLAFAIGVMTFSIWHAPQLYDAALEMEGVHIFEHLTLLIAGVIMWWPVFKPIPQGRLSPLMGTVYLFAVAGAEGLLGVIYAIAEFPMYRGYGNYQDDPLHVWPLIRQGWGLTQVGDQQLGGSIMWGFGSVIFLWAMMVLMIDWLREEYIHERRTENVISE